MIGLGIISDYKLAGSAIATLLQQEGSVEVLGVFCSDGWARPLSRSQPQVVLVVSGRRGPQPEELLPAVRAALPQTGIVFLSLVEEKALLLSALRCGVEGALDLTADGDFLVRCIRDVAAGDVVIPQEIARELVREYSGNGASSLAATKALTAREASILRLVARGDSNKGIARQLSISEHTVRAHVRSIIRKLDVANRVQAAAVALRSGLAAS